MPSIHKGCSRSLERFHTTKSNNAKAFREQFLKAFCFERAIAGPGLLGIAAMEIELSELMGGRKVDLRTAGDLSRHFRDEVIHTAELQYAR